MNITPIFIACIPEGVDISSLLANEQELIFPCNMGDMFDFVYTWTADYNPSKVYQDGETKQDFDRVLDATGVLEIKEKGIRLRRVACMNMDMISKKDKIVRYTIEKMDMVKVVAGVQDTVLPPEPPIDPKDPPIGDGIYPSERITLPMPVTRRKR